MPKEAVTGSPYDPQTHQVDEWSNAIYARLSEWDASKDGTWERWEPGYLLLTVAKYQGKEIEPVMLYTADDELTVTFGYWEIHLPACGPLEADDDEEAVREARELVDGWLAGKLHTAIYFDAADKWCGSILVEDEDVLSRLHYGLKFTAHSKPSRIELRTPRKRDWRNFTIKGKQIQEVV